MANETTTVGNCNGPNCVGDCKTQIMMKCDVCVSVHGDTREKLCFYCKVCEAYICCKKCRYDFPNRAKAFAIKLEKRAAEAINNVAAKAKEIFTGKPTPPPSQTIHEGVNPNLKPENEEAKTTNRRNRQHRQSDDISD